MLLNVRDHTLHANPSLFHHLMIYPTLSVSLPVSLSPGDLHASWLWPLQMSSNICNGISWCMGLGMVECLELTNHNCLCLPNSSRRV